MTPRLSFQTVHIITHFDKDDENAESIAVLRTHLTCADLPPKCLWDIISSVITESSTLCMKGNELRMGFPSASPHKQDLDVCRCTWLKTGMFGWNGNWSSRVSEIQTCISCPSNAFQKPLLSDVLLSICWTPAAAALLQICSSTLESIAALSTEASVPQSWRTLSSLFLFPTGD